MRKAVLLAGVFLLGACDRNPHITEQLKTLMFEELCGNSYAGRVVSGDPQDADWREQVLTLGPVECFGGTYTMPLAVGEDRSRVWTLIEGVEGIEFRHAHTLPDGSPDPVTGYGGYAMYPTIAGTYRNTLRFPADATTREIFLANGLEASVDNVWSLTLEPGDTLTYALARPNRDFRAEFDLSEPIVP